MGTRIFGGDENVLNLDCGNGCTTLNILKTIELYTLNGCIFRHLKLFK